MKLQQVRNYWKQRNFHHNCKDDYSRCKEKPLKVGHLFAMRTIKRLLKKFDLCGPVGRRQPILLYNSQRRLRGNFTAISQEHKSLFSKCVMLALKTSALFQVFSVLSNLCTRAQTFSSRAKLLSTQINSPLANLSARL